MGELERLVEERIRGAIACQERLLADGCAAQIAAAAGAVVDAYRAGGKLLLFGNGGSAADAQHIAAELVGRFEADRAALPALALTTNASTVTAVANDYDFADVFARQVSALAGPADAVLGISTSGESENVLAGLRAAAARRATTIALTGGEGGRMAALADHWIAVPGEGTARVQEGHILVGHVLCEIVERAMFDGGAGAGASAGGAGAGADPGGAGADSSGAGSAAQPPSRP